MEGDFLCFTIENHHEKPPFGRICFTSSKHLKQMQQNERLGWFTPKISGESDDKSRNPKQLDHAEKGCKSWFLEDDMSISKLVLHKEACGFHVSFMWYVAKLQLDTHPNKNTVCVFVGSSAKDVIEAFPPSGLYYNVLRLRWGAGAVGQLRQRFFSVSTSGKPRGGWITRCWFGVFF